MLDGDSISLRHLISQLTDRFFNYVVPPLFDFHRDESFRSHLNILYGLIAATQLTLMIQADGLPHIIPGLFPNYPGEDNSGSLEEDVNSIMTLAGYGESSDWRLQMNKQGLIELL